MRAMVLAAGLGTRLRPITYELPKPMVPVLDRPVLGHVLDLLHRHGITDAIANLHHLPDVVRDHFGDELQYSHEQRLLGTAGGVRNCRDVLGGETFLVIAGDSLTDLDVTTLVERHRAAGGIATIAATRVADPRRYGVVIAGDEHRVIGFQEKPDPAEALSDLGSCSTYVLEPEIFDFIPGHGFADWAHDVFPALLAHDVPFHVHEIDGYWSDVGSPSELRRGTFDVLAGRVGIEVTGEQIDEGLYVGEGTGLDGVVLVEPPVWIGRDVEIGPDVRLEGPLAIGDNARIGEGAALRDSVLLPGAEVPVDGILAGAVAGTAGTILESLRPRR